MLSDCLVYQTKQASLYEAAVAQTVSDKPPSASVNGNNKEVDNGSSDKSKENANGASGGGNISPLNPSSPRDNEHVDLGDNILLDLDKIDAILAHWMNHGDANDDLFNQLWALAKDVR